MKKIFVEGLRPGDPVEDVFVLSEKAISQKKNGENYLTVVLSDRTGRVKGVAWDDVDHMAAAVKAKDFVHVKGNASEYRGALQLVVKEMKRISPERIDPSDFLPATRRDIDKMFIRLLKIIASMENTHLKKLFDKIWADTDFTNKFKTAPAAKKMHHAYIGGLLEHTLSMALLVDRIAGHYTGIDRDLLLAGAILHDIGKVKEFDFKYSIDYSVEGRLLSHIVIAVQLIDEKIKTIDDFPEELALLVKHMVVSHHGSLEFGSPELPKTIEAVLLCYIDEIDAKVNAIRDFIANEDPGELWTSYHRVLGRHFYTGAKE
jgi:3'-5' exoribonuclease